MSSMMAARHSGGSGLGGAASMSSPNAFPQLASQGPSQRSTPGPLSGASSGRASDAAAALDPRRPRRRWPGRAPAGGGGAGGRAARAHRRWAPRSCARPVVSAPTAWKCRPAASAGSTTAAVEPAAAATIGGRGGLYARQRWACSRARPARAAFGAEDHANDRPLAADRGKRTEIKCTLRARGASNSTTIWPSLIDEERKKWLLSDIPNRRLSRTR